MFQSFALLLVGGFVGWLVPRLLASRAAARKATPPAPLASAAPLPAVDQAPNDEPPPAAVSPEMDEVYSIAAGLEGFYRQSAYPRDLMKNEQFRRGVELIARAEPSSEVLLDYMVGANVMTACMAMEALSHRTDDTPFKETILSNFTQVSLWTAYFALRVLSTRCEEPVVGAVLARVDDEWVNALPINILREFITLRRLRGETPSFGAELNSIASEQAANTEAVLERLRDDVPASLREELRAARESRVDTAFIGAIGRVLHVAAADREIATTARIDEFVGQIERAVSASPPRPIALGARCWQVDDRKAPRAPARERGLDDLRGGRVRARRWPVVHGSARGSATIAHPGGCQEESRLGRAELSGIAVGGDASEQPVRRARYDPSASRVRRPPHHR